MSGNVNPPHAAVALDGEHRVQVASSTSIQIGWTGVILAAAGEVAGTNSMS